MSQFSKKLLNILDLEPGIRNKRIREYANSLLKDIK